MMIPLRRALIVNQHGILKYPEGTACAEVLKAGASRNRGQPRIQPQLDKTIRRHQRGTIFTGFGIGFAYKAAECRVQGLEGSAGEGLRRAVQGRVDRRRELPGTARRRLHHRSADRGHHVRGRRSAYLVLIPMIKFFGSRSPGVLAPGTMPDLARWHPGDRSAMRYILYIGAGAVAAGGIISLVRSLPMIWAASRAASATSRAARNGTASNGSPGPGPFDEVRRHRRARVAGRDHVLARRCT